MNKSEMEQMIAGKLRRSAEEAITKAMHELNATGRRFAPTDEPLSEWIDPGADESPKITCAIGVGLSPRWKAGRATDPVVDAFIARAESGNDRDAMLLNLLEGDIANGGFLQLFANKGEAFIRRGVVLPREIGTHSAARLVGQGLRQIRAQRHTLNNYDILLRKLQRLDAPFENLKENIPALYERHLQRGETSYSGRKPRTRKRD